MKNEHSSKKLASLAGGVSERLKDVPDEALLYAEKGEASVDIGYTVGDFKSLAGSVLTQARDKKANRKVRKALKKLGRGKRGKKKSDGAGRPGERKTKPVRKGALRGTRKR